MGCITECSIPEAEEGARHSRDSWVRFQTWVGCSWRFKGFPWICPGSQFSPLFYSKDLSWSKRKHHFLYGGWLPWLCTVGDSLRIVLLMEEIRSSPVEVGSWNPIICRVLCSSQVVQVFFHHTIVNYHFSPPFGRTCVSYWFHPRRRVSKSMDFSVE